MANKRISEENLVRITVSIPESYMDFLQGIPGGYAAFLRRIIQIQMKGHSAEIAQLEADLPEAEAKVITIKAQLAQLKAESSMKENLNTVKDTRTKKLIAGLVEVFSDSSLSSKERERVLKVRVGDTNKVLINGSIEPIDINYVRDAVEELMRAKQEAPSKEDPMVLRARDVRTLVYRASKIMVKNPGYIKDEEEMISNYVNSINKRFSDLGAEPITVEEIRTAVMERVKAQGLPEDTEVIKSDSS